MKKFLAYYRKLYVVTEPKAFGPSPALHSKTDVGVVIVRETRGWKESSSVDDESDSLSYTCGRGLPSYADALRWQ